MQTITAIDRQTLFDIALEVWGRAELAYDLALANDLTLSDEVTANTVLLIPTVDGISGAIRRKTDRAVVSAYALNGITPATAASQDEIDELNPEGISYWYIKTPVPVFAVSPNKNE